MQIKITPGFLLLLGGLWALDRWGLTLPLLLAAALHECGHLVALLTLKIPITELELRLSGAVIRSKLPGGGREALALAAGPGVNLLLALIFWNAWPLFALCDLALGLGNLLPLPQRDGGRLLRALEGRRSQRREGRSDASRRSETEMRHEMPPDSGEP